MTASYIRPPHLQDILPKETDPTRVRTYRTATGAVRVTVAPDRWTHSATHKAVQRTLGMFGRVWRRQVNGADHITIGMSRGKEKVELAWGKTFQEAFENLFVKPLREKWALDEETPREGAAEPTGASAPPGP